MKQTITICLLLIACIELQAQKYLNKVFTNVKIDSVTYGNANDYNNLPVVLKMNIFQPDGDTSAARPVLVLAHGGSFISGNRYSPDITYLCTEFAKRGYVCISIQYRLGIDFFKITTEGGTQFANAVWRGTLDGRAAIRFLRANAATYKLDTKQIYLGGVSAGGVLGLHEAFLDLASEVGAANPPFDTLGIGGIEGSSGTPGESWRVKGIVNLCGALGDVNWMKNNKDISIFSVHGTNDETVPYKTNYFEAFGIKIAKLSGSFVVDSMAKSLGMKSFFYTFQNAPHVPFVPGVGSLASSTAYMDTTENLLSTFLAEDISRPVGIRKTDLMSSFKLFPNPASSQVEIMLSSEQTSMVQLMDMQGRLIKSLESSSNRLLIPINDLNAGIYLITVTNKEGTVSKKLRID